MRKRLRAPRDCNIILLPPIPGDCDISNRPIVGDPDFGAAGYDGRYIVKAYNGAHLHRHDGGGADH